MKKVNLFLGGWMVLVLFACNSYKAVPYLQNSEHVKLDTVHGNKLYDAKLMPYDEIFIWISCTEPKLAEPFNSQGRAFQIDNTGHITFPVLGKLAIVGLTTREVESMIAKKMSPYLKETPLVIARMSSFKISVLGEVATPGTYSIQNEKVNILEALAMAGDLTIYGMRDNIKLIREDREGHKHFIKINLNDAELLNSPYYFLQQNDILYVTPNKTKSMNSSVNSGTGLWVSGVSILVSLASLFVNIFK